MTNQSELKENIDLIWGSDQIGAVIGRNERQTFHLLSSGQLPAKKIGGRWCAERGELIAFFKGKAA